ncbi:hypothetical protein [uncultured Shewanella sp.]|uniref:hypothetical protein n=1 Tax=uncultured Shewanella sp. TaxID=173975 RepID=UPI002633CA19|nr:hypothetical protein [uncultured Shewanella sp.]
MAKKGNKIETSNIATSLTYQFNISDDPLSQLKNLFDGTVLNKERINDILIGKVDNATKLHFFEKIIDILFCGSQKHQAMEYLKSNLNMFDLSKATKEEYSKQLINNFSALKALTDAGSKDKINIDINDEALSFNIDGYRFQTTSMTTQQYLHYLHMDNEGDDLFKIIENFETLKLLLLESSKGKMSIEMGVNSIEFIIDNQKILESDINYEQYCQLLKMDNVIQNEQMENADFIKGGIDVNRLDDDTGISDNELEQLFEDFEIE